MRCSQCKSAVLTDRHGRSTVIHTPDCRVRLEWESEDRANADRRIRLAAHDAEVNRLRVQQAVAG